MIRFCNIAIDRTRFTFGFLLVALFMIGAACSNNNDPVRDAARESLPQQKAPIVVTPPPASNTPLVSGTPVSTGGVQHYTCPNNCEGSGGSGAGTCPVCGTAYTHNQAWHSQQTTAATPTDPAAVGSIPIPTPTPEPAQNAAGVWHYTCPSGCEGGGGAAGPCATCGATLAHNTAYHN